MIKDMLYIGLGGFMKMKEQIKKELEFLEKKGKIDKEDSQNFLKALYDEGEAEHNRHYEIMTEILKNLIKDLNLATKDDIKALEERLNEKNL